MKKQLNLKLLALIVVLCGLLVACGDDMTPVPATVQVGAIPTATSSIVPTVPTTGPTANLTQPPTTLVRHPTPPPSTPPAPTKSTGNSPARLEAQLATPFKLKFGQVAHLASENMEISLSHIEEDSRCPQNVECVWSGQLIVSVNVSLNGKPAGIYELNNIEAQRKKDKPTFGSYNLALLDATPGRRFSNFGTPNAQVDSLKTEDYVMELVVRKLDLSSVPADQAVLGKRVQLKYGQTASFPGEGLTLKFSVLTKDFRCPKSPTIACATSGEAVIGLAASKGGSSRTLDLTIPGLTDDTSSLDAKSAKVGYITTFENYTIQLISLEPQRTDTDQPVTVAPETYVATLLVTKKA